MASGKYVNCPSCNQRFFVGDEFFTLPEARCHCPYCAHQFSVATPEPTASPSPPGRGSG
jgi:DNA-directed RNA polymerase subunit RPC12/RpoP